MNLFRSEEHMKRWPLFFETVDDYVMSVADWGSVFSASMFRQRLEPDFLARAPVYLEDYRRALKAKSQRAPAPDRILSTLMFTDIVDSTGQAARAGDAGWRSQLERHNAVVRTRIEHFDGREVKQTGDGFMATFAVPTRAIQCASAICKAMRDVGLHVRASIPGSARSSVMT
jgi:class 3 adenylate cyclase